jgi:hypothetical protein
MEHEIAVVVWNEFISQTNNKGIDFSFKDIETRISQTIEKTKTEICSKQVCDYCGKSDRIEPLQKIVICLHCDNEF